MLSSKGVVEYCGKYSVKLICFISTLGLSSKVRRPSSSLKEKLMVRLELHRDSMDILKIVLRINETQGKTVQEVISLAEEKDGELFLDTWRLIFELLSLTKDFEKLVNADHWPLKNAIKTLENALQDQHARDANFNTCKRNPQENAPCRGTCKPCFVDKTVWTSSFSAQTFLSSEFYCRSLYSSRQKSSGSGYSKGG